MALTEYNNVCNEIYHQILQRLERREHENLRFAAKGAAEGIMHREILLRVFQSLVLLHSSEHAGTHQVDITEDLFVQRVERRRLHKFLAVLIFASCSIDATRLFVGKLVAQDAWPVTSGEGARLDTLPARREDLLYLFDGDGITADKITSKQTCFCPVLIHKRMEVRVQNPNDARLPYLADKQKIGSGSFGTVYSVRIAKGYFYDPETQTENPEPIVLARKDYDVSPDFSKRGQGEHDIIQKILKSTAWKCKNILENVGSLEIGNTYSLFMPLAICDLQCYMREHTPIEPSTAKAKANIVRCAEGLAGGLRFLHKEMQTSDLLENLVCYHMDLKPSNVLVFRDTTYSEFDDGKIWKLSDFGMARVKIRGQKTTEERDFNTWFKPKKQPLESTPSPTLNRRGEGTYLAPESISATPSMKTSSDVWALGCVISVVFAYMEEGRRGIEAYQDARMVDGIDRFFVRGIFSGHRLNSAVTAHHKYIAKQARRRSPGEAQIVSDMLSYLEKSVFKLDPKERGGAGDVQEELLKTYRRYMNLHSETAKDLPTSPQESPTE